MANGGRIAAEKKGGLAQFSMMSVPPDGPSSKRETPEGTEADLRRSRSSRSSSKASTVAETWVIASGMYEWPIRVAQMQSSPRLGVRWGGSGFDGPGGGAGGGLVGEG